MSATYKGNPTNYSSATAWAASQVRALGALCTPSTPNGLVFICTTGGTTAAAEPAWNTAPYPTIGTSFTDGGGVGWACYGSQPGNFPTILQLPVDTDPPVSAIIAVTPFQTTADQLAWLRANCGLLAGNNAWIGTNTFANNVVFDGENTVTLQDRAQLVFSDYPVSNAAILGTSDPTSPVYCLTQQWSIGNVSGTQIYARIYAAAGTEIASNPNTDNGFVVTMNAYWYSGHWHYDDAGADASFFLLGAQNFAMGSYQNGQTSPWLEGAWVTNALFTTDTASSPSLTIDNNVDILASLTAEATAVDTFSVGSGGSDNFAVNGNGQVTMVGGLATDAVADGTIGVPAIVGLKTTGPITTTAPNVLSVASTKILTGHLYRVDVAVTQIVSNGSPPKVILTYTDAVTGNVVTSPSSGLSNWYEAGVDSGSAHYYLYASANITPKSTAGVSATCATNDGTSGTEVTSITVTLTLVA